LTPKFYGSRPSHGAPAADFLPQPLCDINLGGVSEHRFALTEPQRLDGLRFLRNEISTSPGQFPPAGLGSASTLLEELQQAQPATPVIIHAPDVRLSEAAAGAGALFMS